MMIKEFFCTRPCGFRKVLLKIREIFFFDTNFTG